METLKLESVSSQHSTLLEGNYIKCNQL